MSRYYEIDGKQYASVTTIIKDCTDNSGPLTQWSSNMCKLWIQENCQVETGLSFEHYIVTEKDLDEMRFNFKTVSQKALDIGSEVHNAIEMYLQNKPFKLTTKEADFAFGAFLHWKSEHKLTPISLEQTVFGNSWAGTLDFYGYFNDKLYVIDWKSSKAHYPEMRYQVAAYRGAMQDKNDEDFLSIVHDYKGHIIQGCGVLRLDKETGMPDWKDTSKTYESDLKVFNAMVDLYLLRHPRIAKKLEG